ncbi:uncharacterized protein SCHCODRAFT_02618535 [Schizophyllum commune H4-8]|uniref:uncharacterized protein n=1 Tax=Schizophyllum commune (strain H4-8 / FGSC 9210) TaxID=578458 RepID=UPI00215FA3E0|nr:uncharacterized protein SCHCODRAFT_02618535 [Schizophyllum commune H4-8]KAI5895080.1 hypothetical protein SCHCODRAFT_02618535 [Schizophyllum commune H4-8]
MSLDKNLFTLLFRQRDDDPASVDLVDPAGTVHYQKRLAAGPVYRAEVTDPLTQSLLASATAPAALNKAKTLELYNPNSVVELKHTGLLTFKWTFKWGEHEFEWKREACYLIRKPDPAVMVAITKEPTGKIQTTSVQILDYNLNRFDIDDRKGLELVILTALLTFQDYNIAAKAPKGSTSATATPSRTNSADALLAPPPVTNVAIATPLPPAPSTSKEAIPATPPVREPVADPAPEYSPPVPPRNQPRSRSPAYAAAAARAPRRSRSPDRTRLAPPALPPRAESSPGPQRRSPAPQRQSPPRQRSPSPAHFVDVPPPSAINRVAEAERERALFSVVRVGDDMNVKSYSQFCCNLLKDDTLMYITVKSSIAKHVDKTMKVAEKVNKDYRKVVKKDSADLHQYVSWDFPAAEDDKKGKKKKSKKGTPPTGVIVHLSKKAMPELEPKLSTPSAEDVPSAASSPAILTPSRPAGHGRYASEPPPKHPAKEVSKKTGKKASTPEVQVSSPSSSDPLAPVRGRQRGKSQDSPSTLKIPIMPRQPSSGRLDIPGPSRSPHHSSPSTPRSASPSRHQRSASATPSPGEVSGSSGGGQSQTLSRLDPISNPFLRPRAATATAETNAQNRQTWFGSFFGRSAVRAG